MNGLTENIQLDFRSDEPITTQIVRQIEKLVRDGMLQPGDQLPTVRQMAIDLRINFSTVARAYNILDERRLISTQRGRGTYIWADAVGQGQAETPAPGAAPGSEPARQAARAFLSSMLAQGYSLAEIRQAFEQELANCAQAGDER